MKQTELDSHSSCASLKTAPKKRRLPRISLRRLFLRQPAKKKPGHVPIPDIETKSESSSTSSPTERDSSHHSVGSSETEDALGLCSPAVLGSEGGVECPLCLTEHPRECFPEISTCHHRSCYECLQQYLKIEITESRVNISCPECAERFHPTDIKMILNNGQLMSKYEEFMLRRVLVAEPDTRWCPAPDCSYAVIASGCASCPKLKCERPGCETYFCYHCKQIWHPNQTCDAARAQRSPNIQASSISFNQDSSLQRDDIKPCPRCQALIVKMDDGSCNHMTCAVCGAEFCWLCMKEISDLHYLSPSGCTFWGKKPWSRKKKILWQLGTLVGAPVGIGLVAGIAVPAMIIGIPVWVGRKLHAKYENAPRHRRNLAITGGVSASILVSPILAGLAVGIGVPILLAYVYGVVPVSLCRSGGCGVTTSASGVRIEFDDDNDPNAGTNGPVTDLFRSHVSDAQSADISNHQVANPSIGEFSVGLSTSLSASGSQLERVGLIRDSDRDSASNTAIAGASLNGSLCSNSVAGSSGYNKLEVQADVSSNLRFSLSSESATVSLSEKSVIFADDASTRGLAGSILSGSHSHRNSMSTYTPVEVHVDCTNIDRTSSISNLSHHGLLTETKTSDTMETIVSSDDQSVRSGSKSKRVKLRSESIEEALECSGDTTPSYEAFSLHDSISDELKSDCSSLSSQDESEQCLSRKASIYSSLSQDSSPGGLTEIENDQPSYVPTASASSSLIDALVLGSISEDQKLLNSHSLLSLSEKTLSSPLCDNQSWQLDNEGNNQMTSADRRTSSLDNLNANIID